MKVWISQIRLIYEPVFINPLLFISPSSIIQDFIHSSDATCVCKSYEIERDMQIKCKYVKKKGRKRNIQNRELKNKILIISFRSLNNVILIFRVPIHSLLSSFCNFFPFYYRNCILYFSLIPEKGSETLNLIIFLATVIFIFFKHQQGRKNTASIAIIRLIYWKKSKGVMQIYILNKDKLYRLYIIR